MLCAGVPAALAQASLSRQAQANFQVQINFTPQPSVCATQASAGSASVSCLSNEVPAFSAPGRSDVSTFSSPASRPESAAQVPSTTNLEELSPTAAGESVPKSDGRTLESAELWTPAGTPPLEEIEVSF